MAATASSWRSSQTGWVLTGELCLMLAALLGWWAAGTKSSRFSRSAASLDKPVPLDSFSEPAVACPLLRQESDWLLMETCEMQEQRWPLPR